MISALHIDDATRTPIKWWPDVDALKRRKKFTFKPGINVIWGPNGIGKSTIIKAMARLLHAEQSGNSIITSTSTGELRDTFDRENPWRDGLRVDYDGQPISYIDPQNRPGLFGGMAAFDYDFTDLGMSTLQRDKVSSGQSAMAMFHTLAKRPKTFEIHGQYRKHQSCQEALERVQGTIKQGPRTILWDEPDANLDWPSKAKFWDMMLMSPMQHIVATHSPFALRMATYLDDINLIPIGPKGYADECRKVLSTWGLWSPHDADDKTEDK